MTDGEMISYIKREIQRQIQIVMYHESGTSTAQTEDIKSMLPGMATQSNRPLVLPYGFASRAAQGVLGVNARLGDHPANRIVIGHRDPERPSVQRGESTVYSFGGFECRVTNSGIELRKGDTIKTAVVADDLKDILSTLLQELVIHTHAAPGAPPTNAAQFTQLKTQVDQDKFFAKDGGAF